LAWYRGLPFDAGPNGFDQATALRNIQPFLCHFRDLFQADSEQFLRAFGEYLLAAVWPTGQPAVRFWDVLATYRPTHFSEERASYRLIATMALILMRMPCSEAEVERVFSHMRAIIGRYSARTKRDLLESRLILQMNGSAMSMPREQLAALDGLEELEGAGPDEGEVAPHEAWGVASADFTVPLIPGPRRSPDGDYPDFAMAGGLP
jgi:hypothetical protein